MNIELIEHQTCKVYIKLLTTEAFDVYGGTTKNQFSVSKTESGEHLVLITAPRICSCGGTGFDIFARRKSSNQEWLIVSGRINTKDRKSSVSGTAVSPLEYHLEIPVTENIEELEVPPVYVGIPGERGERGEQGIQGERGLPGEQGIQGERGYSAFDIAVQHGYIGTEAEFIDMLMTFEETAQRAVEAQNLAEIGAVNALKYAQEAQAILEEIKGVTTV